MKVDLKNTYTKLTIVVGILAIFGVSIRTVIHQTKDVWKSPEVNASQDTMIAKQNVVITRLSREVHFLEHVNEMSFQLLRLMTDDRDTRRYKIVIESSGAEYKVDVRETAERVELAFVEKLNIVYPIYIDHADGRMYVIFHDINENENQNVYLELI